MTVEQLLTDNGSAYRSTIHAIACRALGIRHLRTRPRRPQTNGKACVLAWRGRPAGRRGSPRLSV
jgi:transposase InsO family protein